MVNDMSDPKRHDWPTQEPAPDFAVRTARFILDSQQAPVSSKRVRASGVRWRKPGFVVLAAALLSASAWGAIATKRYFTRNEPQKVDPVVKHLATPVAAKPMVKALAPEPPTQAEPVIQPSAKPIRTKVAPPAVSASAAAAPSILPKPRVPPCWCDPGAVLCGCAE
jgi:hypothetical protein